MNQNENTTNHPDFAPLPVWVTPHPAILTPLLRRVIATHHRCRAMVSSEIDQGVQEAIREIYTELTRSKPRLYLAIKHRIGMRTDIRPPPGFRHTRDGVVCNDFDRNKLRLDDEQQALVVDVPANDTYPLEARSFVVETERPILEQWTRNWIVRIWLQMPPPVPVATQNVVGSVILGDVINAATSVPRAAAPEPAEPPATKHTESPEPPHPAGTDDYDDYIAGPDDAPETSGKMTSQETDPQLRPEWEKRLQDLIKELQRADALVRRDEFLTAAKAALPGCLDKDARELYAKFIQSNRFAAPASRPTKKHEPKIERGSGVLDTWVTAWKAEQSG